MLMAAARLDLPSVFVYNGSILPGHHQGVALDVVSVFEAVGACAAGTITEEELGAIERRACPGEGACAGMFTANTMADRGRGPRAQPARHRLAARRRPAPGGRRPATPVGPWSGCSSWASRPARSSRREAFENAITVVNAVGGSTNAVLHLLAIANEAGVALSLDDFNRVAARVPHIADMKPGGKFHMSDLDAVGGTQVVMRHLLEAGLLHGDCLTVTGRTMAENLARARSARTRRRRRPPPRRSHPPRGGDRGADGVAGTQGVGREGGGPDQGAAELRRHGQGVRAARRQPCEAILGGSHRARHRPRHPLRGAQGRARACGRCWPSPAPSRVRGGAPTAR